MVTLSPDARPPTPSNSSTHRRTRFWSRSHRNSKRVSSRSNSRRNSDVDNPTTTTAAALSAAPPSAAISAAHHHESNPAAAAAQHTTTLSKPAVPVSHPRAPPAHAPRTHARPAHSDASSSRNSRHNNRLPAPSQHAMSAVRRLLTGANAASDSSAKMRAAKALGSKQAGITTHIPPPAPCAKCAARELQTPDMNRQIVLMRELSARVAPDPNGDRLEDCVAGDYNTLLKLFQVACDVQQIVGAVPLPVLTPGAPPPRKVANSTPSMSHMRADRLNAMAVNLFGTECTVTLVSNGSGVLLVVQREGLLSLLYEGMHFDIAAGEETPIDVILKASLEMSIMADLDDLKAILSSIKIPPRDDASIDAIDELLAGGLDIPALKLVRPEFFTTRVLCMMTATDVYEQGFYKKYVHVDRLGTSFTAVREGETSTLSKINVMPDAVSRRITGEKDILGEDIFMARRKGRKDKFRLTCSVSVNVWEEYETPEWFGYIHPPPNADAVRPANLNELRDRLESYGIPDGMEICRLVYHCLGHKSRNSNVKVDSLSAARSYFMYLKNFLKHGTTGGNVNHVIEGDEMAVVYDGIAYRVGAPQTEMRHRSLFISLVLSDERERNGKNIPKRSVIRRMCSTSEVVLSLCKDITYLNAEYDEDGGTLYSASAEEENTTEAWSTCMALFVCDGYGCLEGCFNCAIENRRGAIVDEMAVFMNDVQVPVVFDKLYRKTSIAEELSTMSDARGATYPGAFISGRDQCNERTYLAGHRHRLSRSSLQNVLRRDLRLSAPVAVRTTVGVDVKNVIVNGDEVEEVDLTTMSSMDRAP